LFLSIWIFALLNIEPFILFEFFIAR